MIPQRPPGIDSWHSALIIISSAMISGQKSSLPATAGIVRRASKGCKQADPGGITACSRHYHQATNPSRTSDPERVGG